MTKKELIKALAVKEGISEADARNALAGVLSVLLDTFKEGESIVLSGFGRFDVKKIKAHTKALNSEIINVPEKYKVTFSLSRDIKSNELNTEKDNGLQNLLSNLRIDQE